MSPVPRLLARISVALLLLPGSPAFGATLFDPALRFRTIATDHFIIYFHQGEERLAARLAGIAEDVRTDLAGRLGVPLQTRTHVVLADQSELSNGSAFPLPYNTVVVAAAWPPGSEFIGHTDDWLRLVFTHEFTHLVHLDRSGGWAKVVRRIFGRTPLAFPNVFLPTWQIEGLAVFEESQRAGQGRLHAGDFRAIEREAARMKTLLPLDRVNGGLNRWPDGYAPYAYGAGFHAFLVEQYGAETLRTLADRSARRLPFFVGGAFEGVFGRPLDRLWQDYEASLNASLEPAAPVSEARQLTHHGFTVIGPRFVDSNEIVYSVRTPHAFPALNTIAVGSTEPRRLATRYLGSTVGVGDRVIVFDQQEIRRNAGLYSDLFVLDRASEDVTRLTSGARLLDPDVSPDEQSIVCVREGLGQRELVVVRSSVGSAFRRTATLADITTLISEPDTQFNAPRWSPDGRLIAVERHVLGHDPEIVVVNWATRSVRVLASQAGTRFVTPTWRPDGKAIVAAAAAKDDTFDLYEFPLQGIDDVDRASARRLTHTTGGATWPDISRDGSTIAFVGYTVNGFELFTIPYPTAGVVSGFSRTAPGRSEAVAGALPASTRYNPLRTLMPTSWTPVIEGSDDDLRMGIATAGRDVLGYHAFVAAATWTTEAARASATPDWDLAYIYDRWQPAIFASASLESDRSDELEAGVFWPFRRVRVSNHALASVWRAVNEGMMTDGSDLNRTAARFGWAALTAREFGFSVSPERGVRIGTTAELVRTALGSSGNSTTMTADVRAYVRGARVHHVLAVRAAGGGSTGDRVAQRIFSVGGAAPNGGLLDFGSRAFSLLRGFEQDAVLGTRVALLNADYRLPLARPERGVRTIPFFLHTIHAALFTDAGHAWIDRFDSRDLNISAGGELSADVVVGYSERIAITVGAAWTRDGTHGRDGHGFYARIGRAF